MGWDEGQEPHELNGVFLLALKIYFLLFFSFLSLSAERYQEDDQPPETGWKSAIKYFQKDGSNVTRSPQGEEDDDSSDASFDRLLFLDNVIFVNNRLGSSQDAPADWGLRLGFEWDKSWYGKGLYIQHIDYDITRKFSLLGGFYFPSIESQFPLYLKANVGMGYFIGDFTNDTLTVDYNAYTGVRFYSRSGLSFNIEFGSTNYHRLLTSSYVNSWVVSSGLAFLF